MMYIINGVLTNVRPDERRVAFIGYDDAGENNPREYGEWTLAFTDNRHFPCGDHVADREEEARLLKKRGWLCLPVYAYVHSGVAFGLSNQEYPFNDRFDAGRCGYAYVQLAKFGKRANAARLRRALSALKGELETYTAYVNGEVYWAGVEDTRTGEILDSCGGYYGAEAARDAALEMLAALPPEERQLTFKEDAACAAAWEA